MKSSIQCNIYKTNPLLKDVKTPFDIKMDETYCPWAQKQDTGPMGNEKSTNNFRPAIPGPFMMLKNAYRFNGMPANPTENRQYNNNN